jgi:hypothetical protein
MPEFLTEPFQKGPIVSPRDVLVRLLVALVMGCLVALIYRQTRKHPETSAGSSFPTTLIMLAVLIAMVTQVIGDSVARAFSLVGALSIVRFRTIVRDSRDTAFVIFAVIVGMSVGARNPWVAELGILVLGFAAFALAALRERYSSSVHPCYNLNIRIGIGHDAEALLAGPLDQHLTDRELVSIGTGQQGISMDVSYHGRLKAGGSPVELLTLLNNTDGVQSAQISRRGAEID